MLKLKGIKVNTAFCYFLHIKTETKSFFAPILNPIFLEDRDLTDTQKLLLDNNACLIPCIKY